MIVFFITLFVEIFPLILRFGAADIDDVILNCLGSLIQILIYRALYASLRDEEKFRTAITLLGELLF